jgi:hypothetical protein
MTEDAARELPNLSLEDSLVLVRLYAEKESPKYEKAAAALARALPSGGHTAPQHSAEIAASLAKNSFQKRRA